MHNTAVNIRRCAAPSGLGYDLYSCRQMGVCKIGLMQKSSAMSPNLGWRGSGGQPESSSTHVDTDMFHSAAKVIINCISFVRAFSPPVICPETAAGFSAP